MMSDPDEVDWYTIDGVPQVIPPPIVAVTNATPAANGESVACAARKNVPVTGSAATQGSAPQRQVPGSDGNQPMSVNVAPPSSEIAARMRCVVSVPRTNQTTSTLSPIVATTGVRSAVPAGVCDGSLTRRFVSASGTSGGAPACPGRAGEAVPRAAGGPSS